MTTLLAIDSAGAACSVAVARDGRILARAAADADRGHAARLAPLAAEVFRGAGVAAADLHAVVATVGPGSFTGLRVGLAFAHGIALAAGVPVHGMSSFRAHAAAVGTDAGARPLVVALDSRRAERFFQVVTGWHEGEPFAATPEDAVARLPAGPLLLAGDAAADLHAAIAAAGGSAQVLRAGPADAAAVALSAAAMLARGLPLPPARPVYLRPPDVTLPAAAP
ncbi:MAG: tRNA (adenosine(37)-N6)-threonylcarbamoyltransferase complex dimerization subunit type 1 TsaB [Alphaproteobacteria bacterium]